MAVKSSFQILVLDQLSRVTPGTMQYYQVPEDLLEDPDALRPWVERAVEIARQKKARRSPRRRGQ